MALRKENLQKISEEDHVATTSGTLRSEAGAEGGFVNYGEKGATDTPCRLGTY